MKTNYYLNYIAAVIFATCIISCSDSKSSTSEPASHPRKTTIDDNGADISLNKEQAENLAKLPIKCIQNPLPYKAGLVIAKKEDLAMPQEHHPAFYGCFDWHSSVHGHWSLVYLLKSFPDIRDADKIRKMLNENLSAENIQEELKYFSLNKYTASFERTYGWAWLLKLSEELYTIQMQGNGIKI
jgi:hypothetical protein